MKHYILFIDNDTNLCRLMQDFFDSQGYIGKCVSNGPEAIALVRQKLFTFSLAIVDIHMPDMDGFQVMARLRELEPELTLIAFSDDEADFVHNNALDAGAISFVNKDSGDTKLIGIINRHCREYERRNKPLTLSTRNANIKLIESLDIAGCSNHLADVSRITRKYALSNANVFVRGPNGSGKEKIARAIHNLSERKHMPFLAVNCASFSENLIASELFGHAKGAFTGADQNKIGKFKAADGGTIFLDEIGELSGDLQAVLLRVLEEKTFSPVGSNEIVKVDTRVVAATNAPLEEMIKKNTFRQDLFYRLNVLPIHLKPLRERPEDIPYLVDLFLRRANKTHSKNLGILEADVEILMKEPWPGNVRELEHAIERLVLLCDGKNLDVKRLAEAQAEKPTHRPVVPENYDEVQMVKEKSERELIIKAIEKHGSVAAGAREIGMSRTMIRRKMQRYGIKIEKLNLKETAI